MMRTWAGIALALAALSFQDSPSTTTAEAGNMRLEILPDLEIYHSKLHLTFTVACWEIESESKFYSDGCGTRTSYRGGYLGV